MSLEFINKTDFTFDLCLLENILNSLTQKSCELILTNNKEMQKLNQQYRNKNYPTDVLSFPIDTTFNNLLGSIVISLDFARDNSIKYKHSVESEITLLFIHGLLHLLGYDHQSDKGEQRNKEQEIIMQFDLPTSLIVRSEH